MEGTTVDAPSGGDRAQEVERQHCGAGASEQPYYEQDPADELERADQLGGDLGRGDPVVVEVGALFRVVDELAQREGHEEHAGDDPHHRRGPRAATVGA